MVFITTYPAAIKMLNSIGKGTCKDRCKRVWIGHFKYALNTKTNPLKLTTEQRKTLKKKIDEVSGRNGINNHHKTLKKYKTRKSPPYPANQNCGKRMTGNDGKMYKSVPNKNGICSWRIDE
jgi:hypothetical protein